MLKKHMAACLVATAFAASPGFAQSPPSGGTDRPVASGTGSTTAGSSAMQPGASSGTVTPPPAMQPGASAGTTAPPPASPAAGTASSTPPQTSASAGGGGQGQFMTQIQPNQLMASKLIGTTVVGANNESIGDINDVIVDRNGQALAVVVGVGGFLGIGEKDVAVPFQQLDFAASPQASGGAGSGTTTSANTATNSGVSTTGSTGSAQQDSATNRSTATTGNTGNAGSSGAANPGTSGSSGGVPDRVMLRMTKAELEAAPTFSASGRGSGGSTAPKP